MFRTASAASLTLLLSSTSVYALEGKALFDKIVADSKVTVTYESFEEADADTVTLKGLKLTGDGVTVTMDTLLIDGFREEGELVRLDRSESENIVYEFPLDAEALKANPDGKGTMTVASGSSDDVVAPGAVIVATSLEDISGRMKIGTYTLNGIKADFNGDGTSETSMDKLAFAGLDTPLEFRYTKEQLDDAEGPAPEPLKLASFSIDGTKVTYPQGEFTVADFKISDMNVPATINAAPLDWAKTYSSFAMGATSVLQGGKPVFSMDALTASITEAAEGIVESKSAAEGMFIDLTAIPDPNVQNYAKALGYSEIRGRVDGDGRYDVNSGEVSVDKVTIDLDNVASLAMSYKMTGYTPELAQKINALSAKAGAAAGSPAEMMKLLGELKIESAQIDLKDDSITKKLLDFQAGQMGTTGAQLASGAPMFVGMGMAQLGTPKFTEEVAAAVGTFLKEPGTLSVMVKPEAPVSFADIATAAQSAPKAVIEMLNVGVAAK